jgi:hypothetical protein
MKKIILTLVTILALASCAKDDEVPPSLIGKWEVQKWNRFTNGNLGPDEQPFFSQSDCRKAFFELKTNNIATLTTSSGATCEVFSRDEIYLRDGQIFNAYFILPGMDGKIVSLTNSELIFDIYEPRLSLNTTADTRVYRVSCLRLP